MSIRKRIVKNKRKANGIPSGKTGIVYDVFLKFKDEGKFRSYCKRGFLTETEAQKYELGMKSEFIERAKKNDGYQCLDEYLKQWLSDGKVINRWTLNTFSGYEVNIRKHILPVCGHYRLNEINPEICDQILRRMKFQGLSDSSMRFVRRTLCAALNDACSYGYILNNPVDHTITRFKQSDFTPVLYDLKDLAHLMNNAQNRNWECLFLLTGLYGLRRSEALGLKWSHVDFLKREIRIDQQLSTKSVRKQTGELSSHLKTRYSKRTLYLTSYAMAILLRQMQRLKEAKEKSTDQCPFYDQDYVLFRKDGSPFEETHLARQFHSFTDQINLPRCRIHDLRHSAASNLYYLTSDYLAVARILGHTIKGLSNTLGETRVFESTTSLYIHVHPDKEKAAIVVYHDAVEQEQILQKQKPKVISGYNFRR